MACRRGGSGGYRRLVRVAGRGGGGRGRGLRASRSCTTSRSYDASYSWCSDADRSMPNLLAQESPTRRHPGNHLGSRQTDGISQIAPRPTCGTRTEGARAQNGPATPPGAAFLRRVPASLMRRRLSGRVLALARGRSPFRSGHRQSQEQQRHDERPHGWQQPGQTPDHRQHASARSVLVAAPRRLLITPVSRRPPPGRAPDTDPARRARSILQGCLRSATPEGARQQPRKPYASTKLPISASNGH